MRLSELSIENKLRNQESFPTCADWTATDWATALAGEVGELCNFIKKHRRGDVVNVEDIGKELADVIIYADLIATFFKIDLEGYTARKFNEVSERVKSPRRLSIFDDSEMKVIVAENQAFDMLEFLKARGLEHEYKEWLKRQNLLLTYLNHSQKRITEHPPMGERGAVEAGETGRSKLG